MMRPHHVYVLNMSNNVIFPLYVSFSYDATYLYLSLSLTLFLSCFNHRLKYIFVLELTSVRSYGNLDDNITYVAKVSTQRSRE